MVRLLKKLTGFLWDAGNQDKNSAKHNVSFKECEQAFADSGAKLFNDAKHSLKEKCYLLFAKTENHRLLVIAFTIRKAHVKVVSARDMSKKERTLYEKTSQAPKI